MEVKTASVNSASTTLPWSWSWAEPLNSTLPTFHHDLLHLSCQCDSQCTCSLSHSDKETEHKVFVTHTLDKQYLLLPHLTAPLKPFRDQVRHIFRRATLGLSWLLVPPGGEDWEPALIPSSEPETRLALAAFHRYALAYFLQEYIDLARHFSLPQEKMKSSHPTQNLFEHVVHLLSSVPSHSPWRCCRHTEQTYTMRCGNQGVVIKAPTDSGFVCHQCSPHSSAIMGCRHDPAVQMGTKHVMIGCTQCPTFHFHHCHFMKYIDQNNAEQQAILMFENMPKCVFCMFPQ